MKSWIAVGVGAALFATGLLFIRWHVLEWREEKNDPALDLTDRKHFYARYRRRMQTSGILVVLGILIPLGDWLIDRNKNPLPATIVWIVVLVLTMWVILMALGDMLSTRTHSQVALSKVRQKQKELERQVAELRSRDSNGHTQKDAYGDHD